MLLLRSKQKLFAKTEKRKRKMCEKHKQKVNLVLRISSIEISLLNIFCNPLFIPLVFPRKKKKNFFAVFAHLPLSFINNKNNELKQCKTVFKNHSVEGEKKRNTRQHE